METMRAYQKNPEGVGLKNSRWVDRFEDFAEVAINLFCAFVAFKLIWIFVRLLNP